MCVESKDSHRLSSEGLSLETLQIDLEAVVNERIMSATIELRFSECIEPEYRDSQGKTTKRTILRVIVLPWAQVVTPPHHLRHYGVVFRGHERNMATAGSGMTSSTRTVGLQQLETVGEGVVRITEST